MSRAHVELAREVAELRRRMNNIVTLGKIAQADYPKARVKVRLGEGLVTDWLPWLTQRAHNEATWDAPEVGELCVLLSPQGELGNGVVLPGIAFNDFPALSDSPSKILRRHADGARDDYDRDTHRREVEIPSPGSLQQKIGAATRNQTHLRIDDTADIIQLEGGVAQLLLDDDSASLSIGAADLTLTPDSATLTVGGASITISGGKIILDGEVELGMGGALKKVARVGDTVAGGVITTGSDTVKTK